ncbi:MAG: dicarboxylate/amino acid:cation symporter [Oligoflexia bacterium]|nr:dicarboxylate/amino acid:cation symporter [Oligoflexia bacterium]
MKKSFLSSWGIFIGLIAGALIGLVFHSLKAAPLYSPLINFILDNVFLPMKYAFFNSLFMIIVPLVFSSLVIGVADMKNPAVLGQLSKRLVVFYACSTLIAIFIGQIFVSTLKPGQYVSKEKAEKIAVTMKDKISSLKEDSSMVGTSLWPGIVKKIIPKNIIDQFGRQNILAVIFVSLLFGFGLLYMPNGPPKDSFISFFSAVSHISINIIKWIMVTAPVAVMAILAIVVSELGWDLIKTLLMYMFVLTLGMLFHLFGTYSLILKFLVKTSVKDFFVRMVPVFSTAFSTSSSSATMPVTMDTLEKRFGVPRKIVSFSIPIGVTVNMDGTALFEVAAAIFISQVFGIPLTWTSTAVLVILIFITSVGIAGVPSGSIPVLMSCFIVLGLPAEGIALILGVDRLMDMGRTVINVTGDSVAALYLSRKENINLNAYIKENPI